MTLHPTSPDELALILRDAVREDKKVSVAGTGNWSPTEGDLAISTDRMASITELADRDLTMSVEAGATMDTLHRRLAAVGLWLPCDSPGGDRSVGSIIATGTSGPLADSFGPIRDQLLGLTFVTGNGRVITAGGKVMKNVAGFDMTRLVCGSFGTLGIITDAHFRLRPKPQADCTLTARPHHDTAWDIWRTVTQSRTSSACLLNPGSGKDKAQVTVRFTGSVNAVQSRRVELEEANNLDWREEESGGYWGDHSRAVLANPISLTTGSSVSTANAVTTAIDDLLPRGSAWVQRNLVRWAGAASVKELQIFRRTMSESGTPVTVERAPWGILKEVGVFGHLSPETRAVTERLHDSFDPNKILTAGGVFVTD